MSNFSVPNLLLVLADDEHRPCSKLCFSRGEHGATYCTNHSNPILKSFHARGFWVAGNTLPWHLLVGKTAIQPVKKPPPLGMMLRGFVVSPLNITAFQGFNTRQAIGDMLGQ
jgi:hypothetical protein